MHIASVFLFFQADVFSYGIMLCEMIAGCPGADPDEGVPRTKVTRELSNNCFVRL